VADEGKWVCCEGGTHTCTLAEVKRGIANPSLKEKVVSAAMGGNKPARIVGGLETEFRKVGEVLPQGIQKMVQNVKRGLKRKARGPTLIETVADLEEWATSHLLYGSADASRFAKMASEGLIMLGAAHLPELPMPPPPPPPEELEMLSQVSAKTKPPPSCAHTFACGGGSAPPPPPPPSREPPSCMVHDEILKQYGETELFTLGEPDKKTPLGVIMSCKELLRNVLAMHHSNLPHHVVCDGTFKLVFGNG